MPDRPQQDEHADIKIFNDSVHGTIQLHPLLVKIIDTPEFQRLRNIKQLGATYRVYPSASHNRFEHSIGTCHLAGVFIEKLRSKQPDLHINDIDVLCVKIAGLCHDLGHGPFSDLIDEIFPDAVDNWKANKISLKMLRHLYRSHEDLKEEFEKYKLEQRHLDLICLLIDPPEEKKERKQFLKDKDLQEKKLFLFEIVSNDNGLDVDHWDCIARDCLQLGLGYSFDHLRCMETARVIDGEIRYRDKERANICNMFFTIYNLNRCAYNHRETSAVQLMIADALKSAKDSLEFEGEDGKKTALNQIHGDMPAYSKATDSVYYTILDWRGQGEDNQTDPMKEAKQILQRIEKRDIYQVFEIQVEDDETIRNIDDWLQEFINNQLDNRTEKLTHRVINLGFEKSMSEKLNEVKFYTTEENPNGEHGNQNKKLPPPIASMSTKDTRIRVYYTGFRSVYKADTRIHDLKKELQRNFPQVVNGQEQPDKVEEKPQGKIFNDSVHGTIQLSDLLVKFIDTPEFQRLRNIKQLGAGYRVYPAASHNRFEHSIGVCHLAGVFIEKLKSKQKSLDINEEDVMCVKIAGLCHDIGHGPFSHLFDKEFKEQVGGHWTHERISVKMLKHVLKENEELKNAFYGSNGGGNGKFDKRHLKLICKLIDPPKSLEERKLFLEENGFGKNKVFLFEIVSNENGLDVDRWDYFARDCRQLGLGYSFDHLRCMETARVIGDHICYRDKEKVNIYNMFYTRYNLYRCAYLHKVSSAVQIMIAEAFHLANESGKLKFNEKVELSLDKIFTDMAAYSKATDEIYYKILNWSTPAEVVGKLEEAQKLLQRIEKRDIYQVIEIQSVHDQSYDDLKKQVENWIKETYSNLQTQLVVKVINIGFGGKTAYPLNGVKFFNKAEQPKVSYEIKKDELPAPIASMSTKDIRIRVYCKLPRCEYEDKEEKEQLWTKFKTSLESEFRRNKAQ